MMAAMHRVALVALLLVGCASPSGAALEFCGAGWSDAEPVIVTPDDAEPEPVPIACVRRIGERRLRIGFEMPPGPDCHRLAGVEIDEGADAVAVTLLVVRVDDPMAGPCAPRSLTTTTEVDLQAPIGERELLDGSRADD